MWQSCKLRVGYRAKAVVSGMCPKEIYVLSMPGASNGLVSLGVLKSGSVLLVVKLTSACFAIMYQILISEYWIWYNSVIETSSVRNAPTRYSYVQV